MDSFCMVCLILGVSIGFVIASLLPRRQGTSFLPQNAVLPFDGISGNLDVREAGILRVVD